MALTKEQILAKKKPRVKELKVPAWEDSVFIRTMTSKERDNFEASALDRSGKARNFNNIRARFAVICLSDDKGNRIFADADAAAVGDLDAKSIDLIWEDGRKFNGMTDEDVKAIEGN